MAPSGERFLEPDLSDGPCPRCGHRELELIYKMTRSGRPTVALLGCVRCRYTYQVVFGATSVSD
jgi:hypothetical protein